MATTTLIGYLSIQTPQGTQRVPVWRAAEISGPALRLKHPASTDIGAIRLTSIQADAELPAIRIAYGGTTYYFLDPSGVQELLAAKEAVQLGEHFSQELFVLVPLPDWTEGVSAGEHFTKQVVEPPYYRYIYTEGVSIGEHFSQSLIPAPTQKLYTEGVGIGEHFTSQRQEPPRTTQTYKEGVALGEHFSHEVRSQ